MTDMMFLTPELRFIERDKPMDPHNKSQYIIRERILQQRWRDSVAPHHYTEWRDVPFAQETDA